MSWFHYDMPFPYMKCPSLCLPDYLWLNLLQYVCASYGPSYAAIPPSTGTMLLRKWKWTTTRATKSSKWNNNSQRPSFEFCLFLETISKEEAKQKAKNAEIDGHRGVFRQATKQEILQNKAIRFFIPSYGPSYAAIVDCNDQWRA